MFAQQNTSAHAPSIALLEEGRTSPARPTETTPCLTTEIAVAERKGKEEYLYSAFLAKVVHSKRSGMDQTVLPANNTVPAFPSSAFTRWHHYSN